MLSSRTVFREDLLLRGNCCDVPQTTDSSPDKAGFGMTRWGLRTADATKPLPLQIKPIRPNRGTGFAIQLQGFLNPRAGDDERRCLGGLTQ
jgi:hypothetical protein